ncbi:MAG: phenylacetic acid degradation protein [Alphaproteobacteria bacterium TMED89]|nr:phenylacetic acid degradation protein [Rhodospirillaceae bacterium]RPH10713.1 MAG: phenylacetic acid degradation protein [Alphaproteobacteria bacterium TMED89]
MSRFHKLLVTDVRKTTREASIVSLQPEDAARFEFEFVPGQYLTFRHSSDEGEELRRSYSLCSAPDEGVLQVGVKKVEGGVFSTWVNETLKPGMTLEAMPPMGGFHQPFDTPAPRQFLAFAVGSGITPILSIMKALLTDQPQNRFALVFANRSINTIMFRDELEDLKNRFLGRMNIVHILKTGGDDAALFQGRLDRAKCDQLLAHWIDARAVDRAYICGPEPMMHDIAASLREQGLNETQIRFELFGSTPKPRRSAARSSKAPTTDRVAATLTLDGATSEVGTTRDISILDTALQNGLDAPFACKAGVCSTCKCKVLAGEVEMVANHALEDYEVADGYVLSCQAFAVSDAVSVVYEDH